METGIPEPQSQLSAEKDILDRAADRSGVRPVGKLCTTLTIRIGKTRRQRFFVASWRAIFRTKCHGTRSRRSFEMFHNWRVLERARSSGESAGQAPGRYAKHVARRCARRSFPGLPAARIATRPLAEGAYLLATRWAAGRRQGERLVGWRNFIFDRSVARFVKRERPAGVICFDTCAIETFRAARRLGIRTILDVSIAPLVAVRECYLREADRWPEFADSLRHDLSPEYFAREAQELLLADCVLAPSAVVRRAVEGLGVPPDRIADVPFGVDLKTFAPGPRKPDDTFRVLFVGKLTQRKGLAQLLEAFRRLRLPGAQLEIVGNLVGSGRWLPRYRDIFEWHREGPHAELAERYRRADVFVLPSLHEGSALVTYEALASGLPIITTPQTGSVVRDGVEGFLVPGGEIEPLAERLLELFRDPERRRDMATRARRRAEEFSWEAYGERLAAAVRRTLAREGAHDCAAAHGAARGERTDLGGAIATHS